MKISVKKNNKTSDKTSTDFDVIRGRDEKIATLTESGGVFDVKLEMRFTQVLEPWVEQVQLGHKTLTNLASENPKIGEIIHDMKNSVEEKFKLYMQGMHSSFIQKVRAKEFAVALAQIAEKIYEEKRPVWRFEEEWFNLLGRFHYDVKRAKEILAERNAIPEKVHLEPFKEILPRRDQMLSMTLDVSFTRIDKDPDIDPEFPVIIAHTPSGGHFPIDGAHRLVKAVEQGLDTVNVHLLTPKESSDILQ